MSQTLLAQPNGRFALITLVSSLPLDNHWNAVAAKSFSFFVLLFITLFTRLQRGHDLSSQDLIFLAHNVRFLTCLSVHDTLLIARMPLSCFLLLFSD